MLLLPASLRINAEVTGGTAEHNCNSSVAHLAKLQLPKLCLLPR